MTTISVHSASAVVTCSVCGNQIPVEEAHTAMLHAGDAPYGEIGTVYDCDACAQAAYLEEQDSVE